MIITHEDSWNCENKKTRRNKVEKVTLKLTKTEWELFEGKYNQVKMFCQGKDFVLDVLDVDKFRKFLNDEIDKIYCSDAFIGGVTMNEKYSFYHYQEKIDGDVDAMKRKLNNLKSILNKLN